MCGIIGIITKQESSTKNSFKEALDLAIENKHRGDKDGFGIISMDSDSPRHTLKKATYSLSELSKGSLDSVYNADAKKEDLEKIKMYFEKISHSIQNDKSDFILLHHRKASVGGVSLKNTHPFKVQEDVYYMHNGTVYDITLLKSFLETMYGMKFNSDTDTEVIARVLEGLIKNNKTLIEALNTFNNIFYWYGVLIRVDTKKKEIMILKDKSKTLFLYEFGDKYILSSENINTLSGHTKLFYIDEGSFILNRSGLSVLSSESSFVDITFENEKFYATKGNEMTSIKCDVCSETSNVIKRLPYEVTKTKLTDTCLSCFVNGNLKRHLDDELKKEKARASAHIHNHNRNVNYNTQPVRDPRIHDVPLNQDGFLSEFERGTFNRYY